jgi:DNA-binding response OmpR family regulator
MTLPLLTNRIESETRLLIVDDEPNIRSALRRAFEPLGYQVEEAASGEAGLTLLEQIQIDLMILDLRMPGLHGIEVMQRVHRLRPELLIVVLTGHATLESAVEAIKSKVIDYLFKPASTQEIVATVLKALAQRNSQRQRQQLINTISQAATLLHQSEPLLAGAADPFSPAGALLHIYPLTLHREKRLLAVTNNGFSQTLALTEGEATVLASLMTFPDRVLSCRDLIQTGWGYSTNEHEAQNIVRPHICRLRQKITGVIHDPTLIATVRKRGYIFSSANV